jgi:hypothetical protein
MFVLWILMVMGSAAIILALALLINCFGDEQPKVQVGPVNGINAAREEPHLKSNMAGGNESKRASV